MNNFLNETKLDELQPVERKILIMLRQLNPHETIVIRYAHRKTNEVEVILEKSEMSVYNLLDRNNIRLV